MKKILAISIFATLLTGCMTSKQVNIPYSFDAHQAKQQLETGKETLKGNAFLRQKGGGVVNCAGSAVDLYPYSQYSNARLDAQYPVNAWLGSRLKSIDTFTPNVPEFEVLKKTTTCDAEGNFEFESIKDGNYIVVTEVVWSVPGQFGMERQGGYLIKNVTVSKGHKSKIVISQ
ncbi:Uncharacterised protein [[Actinobacillus] rossii]|uniref:Lipoprotein n=1 Tax=[Actinobacillus] rossii TaxID=123820 RepID=A0A380TXL1_9PAST|nr:Uncharacterised protein [[Actinobacillus] rossii]